MNKYLILKIDFRLLIILISAFIFTTVAGTLSHEFGHYLAGKYIGIDGKIHYASTSFSIPDDFVGIITRTDSFLITLGGPIQTILTSIIGLLLLYFNRKKIKSLGNLTIFHWIYIFMSLFWLRQTANFTLWIAKYLINGRFPNKMDEIKLARNLEIPEWSIIFPTAVIGFIITIYVIITYIPIKQRFTFIISGLIGGISGFYLWLDLFGKLILP